MKKSRKEVGDFRLHLVPRVALIREGKKETKENTQAIQNNYLDITKIQGHFCSSARAMDNILRHIL